MYKLSGYFFSLIFLFFTKLANTKECDYNQVNCINCKKYQTCDGKNIVNILIPCDNGNGCGDPHFETCQYLLNCESTNNYALGLNDCTEIGIFPDVTFESNFYVCLDDSESGFLKFEFSCLSDEFFDNSTLQCMPKEFTVPSISGSTPIVTSPTTPVESDKTITMSSKFVSAESSTIAITTIGSVVTTVISSSPAATETSTSEISITNEPTTETSTSESTTLNTAKEISSTGLPNSTPVLSSPAPTTSPFSCSSPGVFADPSNCKAYFRCSTSLVKFNYTCPGLSYFNEILLKCSLTITPTCQEQIMNNSITQSSDPSLTPKSTVPITKITIESSTSPMPKTEPSTTEISTSTSSIEQPFSCSMVGVFANPVNCKTYYRCSESGKAFMYTCPGDSYFNEITKTCSLTMTPQCQEIFSGLK